MMQTLGKSSVHDVITFAHESADADTMQTIDGAQFDDIIASGDIWLVDFFAPVSASFEQINNIAVVSAMYASVA